MARHRFCCECGHPNKDHDAAAAVVMGRGHRKGAKRVRPSEFDVEQMVRDHFPGLRAVTDAGKLALIGTNGDSSSGSSSSSSEEEEVAAITDGVAGVEDGGAGVQKGSDRAPPVAEVKHALVEATPYDPHDPSRTA